MDRLKEIKGIIRKHHKIFDTTGKGDILGCQELTDDLAQALFQSEEEYYEDIKEKAWKYDELCK